MNTYTLVHDQYDAARYYVVDNTGTRLGSIRKVGAYWDCAAHVGGSILQWSVRGKGTAADAVARSYRPETEHDIAQRRAVALARFDAAGNALEVARRALSAAHLAAADASEEYVRAAQAVRYEFVPLSDSVGVDA